MLRVWCSATGPEVAVILDAGMDGMGEVEKGRGGVRLLESDGGHPAWLG